MKHTASPLQSMDQETQKQIGRMTFAEMLIALAKAQGLKAILSVLLAFWAVHFLAVANFMAMCTVLVICDLITGIWASAKKKVPIHSSGLRRTIHKIVFYMLAILLSQGIQETWLPAIPLVYMVSLFIGMTEFISNLENISIITGTNIAKHIKSYLIQKLNRDHEE